MRKIKLEIVFEEPKYWSGSAFLGTVLDPQPYRVFANSLEELRTLIKEVEGGALGFSGVEFEEVFLTNSKVSN